MKKLISVVLSVVILASVIPIAAYSANITSEISLEEFSNQLQDLQTEYNNNYFSTITIENGSEIYYIDGEENIIDNSTCDMVEAVVTDNDFKLPLSAIADYCDSSEISAYFLTENTDDITLDKETAQDLGFVVDIEEDTAVLTQPYQTGRLIVKSKYDINPLDSVAIVEGYNDLHIVQFDNQESAKEAQEYYENQKLIEYAEPDLTVSISNIEYIAEESVVTSSNINFAEHLSWGSDTIGVDDYIDYLGDVSELPEITVGIIDTGIDLDHEFLQNRIIETGINYSDTGLTYSENDDHGHGTHVAGIVADNTTDNIKIMAYKALNSEGKGSLSNVCLAIYQAISDEINVINMSLSAKGSDAALEEAIKAAVNNNISVCVAAGNNGRNAENYTPASIDECITVAAIDAYDQNPYWTNYGDTVDIVAPGVSIYSAYNDGDYKTLSGTSMASPFVAAACALLLSKDITLNPEQICNMIEESGRKWTDSAINDLYGKLALYIGTVSDFNLQRTTVPTFSAESGRYSDLINVELYCEDTDAEIYYTTDGSRASKSNGILYTKPIVIDCVTRIHAAAYAPDKLKSLQAFADYYITSTDPENNFVIDSNGILIEYSGNNNFLTIPQTINGITVTGLGKELFRFADIEMIKLPDTVISIGEASFRACGKLYSVEFSNVKTIADNAFRACKSLQKIDLTNVESIGAYAFYTCESLLELVNDKLEIINKFSFKSCSSMLYVDLPNVTRVDKSGFENCLTIETMNIPKLEVLGANSFEGLLCVKELELPNLTTLETLNGCGYNFSSCHELNNLYLPNLEGTIPKYAFEFCKNLKILYAPKATKIENAVFNTNDKMSILFIPNVQEALSLPDSNNVKIYLGSSIFQIQTGYSRDENYNCKFIAPSGSFAEQWANDNGYTFIDTNDVNFTGLNSANELVYTSDFTETCIPLSWVADSWDESTINKSRYDASLMMIFDFNNDKVINAKDYAQLIKYKA
ncbi:MAG: S8 family serine peptidase [Eubacterium sp.]